MSFKNKAMVARKIDHTSIAVIDPNDILYSQIEVRKIILNFGIEVMFVLTIQL